MHLNNRDPVGIFVNFAQILFLCTYPVLGRRDVYSSSYSTAAMSFQFMLITVSAFVHQPAYLLYDCLLSPDNTIHEPADLSSRKLRSEALEDGQIQQLRVTDHLIDQI